MKNEKGVALIVLLLILVAVGFVAFSGVKYAQQYAENQKKEDIKANMLAIQSVITNINNKHTIDEENNLLVGANLELENNQTGYEISEELKNSLLTLESANLYILNQEELNNLGIKDITVNNTEIFVVDYNSGEVFYSLGINGKYKLSEI